jgi:methionyl-tRNA formyltransferase
LKNPKIVVFAYSDVGHACLKLLLDQGENVVTVYTHEDRPGENLWFPSVSQLAKDHQVPVRTIERLSDPKEIAHFQSLSPEIVFSFYYRHMIPGAFLSLPRLGAYNMHGSFLPKFRGRAPINWAVLSGETRTGATLHVMIDKPDAGDIVDQEGVEIGPDDTASLVQSKVTRAAVNVLSRQIENLKAGTAPRIKQDQRQASYFGGRQPKDGEINWTWPATRIHNLVRAVTHPYPGAFGELEGAKTFIWKTRLLDQSSIGQPGTVQVQDSRLFVACGDGKFLEILELQRENQNEMKAAEFIRHYLITSEGRKK